MSRERMTMKSGNQMYASPKDGVVLKSLLVLSFILILSIFGAHGVYATQESIGPDGCCWEQVYDGITSRLTGSSDRLFYDWGFKPVEIYARQEEYWVQDCGWWYIGDTGTVNITVFDANGGLIFTSGNISTSKGRQNLTYSWTGADDDPGKWNVTITGSNGTVVSRFYIYVRGQINITSASANNSNPNIGEPIQVDATIRDNAGNIITDPFTDNNGTTITPNVTAYITGPGTWLNLSMTFSGGGWNTSPFSLSATGDYKIVVKATDGHQYWVDGRSTGSNIISVKGNFPYASMVLPFMERMLGGLKGLDFLSLIASIAGLFGIFKTWRRLKSG